MSIAKTSNFRHIYFSDLSLLNIDFICPLWYVCARKNLKDYVPLYLCSLVLFDILNMRVSWFNFLNFVCICVWCVCACSNRMHSTCVEVREPLSGVSFYFPACWPKVSAIVLCTLGWLACLKPSVESPVCLPSHCRSSGITCAPHSTQVFAWVLKINLWSLWLYG